MATGGDRAGRAALAGLLLLLGVAGCAAPRPTTGAAPDALAAVEARLLATPTARTDYAITARGAFTADLTGTLGLGVRGRLFLTADGHFGEAEYARRLIADAERMQALEVDALLFEQPPPPALREAVVIGLTRMGLLHNLARLVAGQPPDHAGGGAADWVTAHDVRWGTEEMVDGRIARPLHFGIRVSGTDSGAATLWLDAETGLPVRRAQTVRFPDGTMEVEEHYGTWDLGDR
ncbi:MAG: hypothetical protein R3362_03275 [Rhodothermales bacterium]|nr:hypothetical protein [Rhodothermales bacterium]